MAAQLISQPILLDQLRKLGGIIFNSVDRTNKQGDYVYDSQLRELLHKLNTMSWKHEVLESQVETVTMVGGAVTALVMLALIALMIVTVKACRHGHKENKTGGSVTSSWGNSMKQTIFHSADNRSDLPFVNLGGNDVNKPDNAQLNKVGNQANRNYDA